MVDRFVNLITLLIFLVLLGTLTTTSYDAWKETKTWEQSWSPIDGVEPNFSADQIVLAIKNAQAQNEIYDVLTLKKTLEQSYKPTGEVLVRFSESELTNIFTNTCGALLLILLPLSINYVRHGRFRLWNKNNK